MLIGPIQLMKVNTELWVLLWGTLILENISQKWNQNINAWIPDHANNMHIKYKIYLSYPEQNIALHVYKSYLFWILMLETKFSLRILDYSATAIDDVKCNLNTEGLWWLSIFSRLHGTKMIINAVFRTKQSALDLKTLSNSVMLKFNKLWLITYTILEGDRSACKLVFQKSNFCGWCWYLRQNVEPWSQS